MNTDVGTNMNNILSWLEEAGMNLLSGILVLVIGFFLVHWIGKLLKRNKKLLTVEPTLRGFLQNLVKIFLSVIVILTAVNMMGIPMTSVVTLLASGGVALGLALQGAVGNLLGGLILLILRPIRAGEYVKIGEHEGVVKTVGAYYTELITVDNKQLCLPNGSLTNTPITNFSREGTRRLDLAFSVDYSSDLDQVYRVLNELVCKGKGYPAGSGSADCPCKMRRQQPGLCSTGLGQNRRLLACELPPPGSGKTGAGCCRYFHSVPPDGRPCEILTA